MTVDAAANIFKSPASTAAFIYKRSSRSLVFF